MEKAVIEGYGPADLVERVRKAEWKRTFPAGKDFTGVSLAGARLSNSPDELGPVKFRLVLEEIPQGDRLSIEGYHAEYVLENVRKRYQPSTFAGYQLSEAPSEGTKAYRATLERVS